MSVALASTQDGPNRVATLVESHNIPPLVPANVRSGTSVPPRAPDALAQENQALGAGESPPVHSPESDSSQSIGTSFVPDADAATMTAALSSKQDRQRRLRSLLHHLTVDPGAPDQELPMAPPLPAPWVEKPPQMRRVDNASVGFSGDCAMLEDRARTGWQFAWLFVLAGVTGALVGWGTVLQLPPLVHHSLRQENTELPIAANVQSTTGAPPLVHDSLPQDNTELPVAANVQSTTGAPPLVHDSLPQDNTELPVAANVQSTTGVPPLVHDSLPQDNTELPIAANVQSTTEVPPLVHDSLPQDNTELPVAANVQSTTGVPPLVHDSLPQDNTELPIAANVQSTTGVPPLVHDSLPQDNKPPLRAAETSSVQAQKHQLVSDADKIAALLERGKDFAAHGDLISARLLFRRAAEAGSAEAALALGETFDPLVFQRLGVIGITPDAASARKWYERATELGSPITSQYLAKPDRAP